MNIEAFFLFASLLKQYYAFILTHLLSGLSIWGSTCKSSLSKLQKLQNKTLKIIGGGKYMDHAIPFYSELKIPELYEHEVAKLVLYFTLTLTNDYQALLIIVPYTFFFTKQSNVNKASATKVSGVKIWNNISRSIKTKQSFKSFKISYKNIY